MTGTVNSASVKSRSRSSDKQNEQLVPEKKRARRRLVGAVALVLAIVIGLPMVLDSEPKPVNKDIAIQIPAKPGGATALDPREELITDLPPASGKEDAGNAASSVSAQTAAVAAAGNTRMPAAVTPAPVAVPAPVMSPAPATPPASAESASKSSSKPQQKLPAKASAIVNDDIAILASPENTVTAASKHALITPHDAQKNTAKNTSATQDAKAPAADSRASLDAMMKSLAHKEKEKDGGKDSGATDNASETTRAMAILENGSAAPSRKIIIQVAAFATQEKVQGLQEKLAAAGITSFTQKVTTNNGSVIRVRVGPFANHDEAEKTKAKLVKLGLNGSVIPD